ncbi:MAG: hypothetical protein ACFCGT_12585 [Sandaracinaceae bacterium]
MESVETDLRLLPSEQVLWEGRPTPGVPRERAWILVPALLLLLALISGLFAALLAVAELPGTGSMATVTFYFLLLAAAVRLAPSFLRDPCRYVVTDRRVLWIRGRLRRSMDRRAVTFARVRWHPRVPEVGHLELVRAVPFGPLARRQRLILHDVEEPDRLLSIIRDAPASRYQGDGEVPLAERLDEGEAVLWGGGPEGLLVGWRDVLTTAGGLVVLAVGFHYFVRAAHILTRLTEGGLPVGSWPWGLLVAAMGLAALLILGVGLGLAWYGIWRARAMGRDTEYILTDRRLLIRRGHVELSLSRERIVDVAETPGFRGVTNLYLILDAPEARALADSGALGTLSPSWDAVPPVLYEVRDVGNVRELLTGRHSRPPLAA